MITSALNLFAAQWLEKRWHGLAGTATSNETDFPWYGHVVPISWWIRSHVREGREELNFSEWTRYTALERHNELESICAVVSNGRMPPP
jgi:hypothetical protein